MTAGRCRIGGAGACSEGGSGRSPNPPTGEPSSSVSLEGRRTNAGPLLFHRAIRTIQSGELIDSGVSAYARFTQRGCELTAHRPSDLWAELWEDLNQRP